MAFATYKLHPRNISFEKQDLKKLIDYIAQKVNDTKATHRQNLNLEGQTEEQRADITKTLDEAYAIAVFVYGADGEEFVVYDSSIIDAPEFPDRLTRLTIDTIIPFRNRTNLAPRNGLRIDLDFSSSRILDWQSSVSAPTPNASEVTIQGIDDGWRAATLAHLQKLFESRKNHRGFLHAAFTYDTYLWLIFIPAYFFGMIAFNFQIERFFAHIPTVLEVAIYLYSFFVFANLYRALIGYIRWTFQSIELTGVPSTQQKHRRFWGFLFTVVVAPILISLVLGR